MRIYILTAFATIFMAVLPSAANADLIVEFYGLTDIEFNSIDSGLDFSLGVDHELFGGASASHTFFGSDINNIVAGDVLRLSFTASNGENPYGSSTATIDVMNNTANPLDFTMRINGSAIFLVDGHTAGGGPYIGQGTLAWEIRNAVSWQ